METSPKPVTVTIDSHQISVPEDTTILEAARQHGIRIPTLCHHPALSAWGGCRMCVVEVDGNPRLTASCVMPVREGMNIVTTNDGIIAARRLILEFLFAERNHNCMFCSQSGDCELQALAYELQMDHLTVPQSFEAFPVDITSEYMAFDHNRCILCGRCVRACREIAGAYVLNYQKRGIQNQIAFDLDVSRSESSCLECGVCMQLCPTGAIFSRYRTHRSVLGHPKSARQVKDSFCTGCGLMCDTQLVIEENQVIRVDGCLHSDHDGPILGQLCVRGRFEILKTPGHRLLTPMIRESDGTWNPSSWKVAMDRIEKNMNGFNTGIFGLVSSRCANEQIMIFRDMMLKGWKADYLNVLEGPSLRSIADAWTELGKTFLALKESHAGRILDADHVLVVGVSAFNIQPAIGGIIRRIILEKGIPATVIGSVDAISPRTRHYIPVTPGKEPVLVQAFLAQVLKSRHQPGTPAWESVLSEFESIDIQKSLSLAGLDTSDQEIFQSAVSTFVHS
ncbi:MAG: 2Fe-2S iron-sulfur cluster-binding protein, partial [Desulfatirhabdiaceae bacterium]